MPNSDVKGIIDVGAPLPFLTLVESFMFFELPKLLHF